MFALVGCSNSTDTFVDENIPVKVGVITLQRKRPWPSCPNPATGNQWSDDMKVQIQQTLSRTPFDVIYAPEDIQVVDDPSLRKALGKYNQIMDA